MRTITITKHNMYGMYYNIDETILIYYEDIITIICVYTR